MVNLLSQQYLRNLYIELEYRRNGCKPGPHKAGLIFVPMNKEENGLRPTTRPILIITIIQTNVLDRDTLPNEMKTIEPHGTHMVANKIILRN